ncbi:MAG: sigma-54 interaction domain-containing protein [Planctomycetia bacterium]|jgi:DNA-binding NtrC family response regulator
MAVVEPSVSSADSRLRSGFGRCPRLAGTSPAAARLEKLLEQVAEFDCPVLVTGETGCGKEEVARAIHAASARASKPFVSVNCGGLVSTLAESQLFGHEKGAFTGAFGMTFGAFRAANGGVVFLDEIGEMPLDLQPKLLHVLQRLEVTPVGSTQVHPVDVQVIAATNRDLETDVAAGRFREDLFYRLNTIHLTVPSLRDRKEDIPRFISHFAAHFARKYRRPQWLPDEETLAAFVRFHWPGNVRQLSQVIQRLYVFQGQERRVLAEIFGDSDRVAFMSTAQEEVHRLPMPATNGFRADNPVVDPVLPSCNLAELRRIAVRQAMAATNGHRGQAAEMLGVSLNTMTRMVMEACPELAPKRGRKAAAKPR